MEKFNRHGDPCGDDDQIFAKNVGPNYYILCDSTEPVNLENYKKNKTTYKLRRVSEKSYNYYVKYLKGGAFYNLENSRRTIDV